MVATMIKGGVNKQWLDHFDSDNNKKLEKQALSVCERNVFNLSTALSRIAYAMGLYDVGSIFNHSCQPNVIFQSTGECDTKGIFRTMLTIDCGEEIMISYNPLVEYIDDRTTRQSILKSNFNFLCKCARCQLEDPPKTTNYIVPSQAACQATVIFSKSITVLERMCAYEKMWPIYWEYISKWLKDVSINDIQRLTILVQATECGMSLKNPTSSDVIRLQVILKRLLLLCKIESKLLLVTQARLHIVLAYQMITQKQYNNAIKNANTALFMLDCLFGKEFSPKLDYYLTPMFAKITDEIKSKITDELKKLKNE